MGVSTGSTARTACTMARATTSAPAVSTWLTWSLACSEGSGPSGGGHGPVPVRGVPAPALRAAGLFSPLMRELAQLSYIFTRPYVMDSAHTQQVLALAPTPWAQVCRRTVTGSSEPARA